MTLIEYNNLSISQRLDLVWEWGYFITKSKFENTITVIFFMDGFFVEVCLNVRENKTELVQGISTDEMKSKFSSPIYNQHFFTSSILAGA